MDQSNLFKEYEKIFSDAEETEKTKESKERIFGYSPFALQDAVGEKSAKKIWIEYQKLRLTGIEPEDLVHKVISKARDMLFIAKGVDKETMGLKDWPYNKSKRDLKNWKTEDLENFYTSLLEVYHRSRMDGGESLNTALEKILISV